MKIAVLMSGQARYIERSAEWWKQRCFTDKTNIHVDYYFNLWDDGTDNLDDRVKKLTIELRCMTCQNQSVYDSDSDFAKDIKILVEDKLREGLNEKEIKLF